jgi:hypothetical protein
VTVRGGAITNGAAVSAELADLLGTGPRDWWTAAELAELQLPGLPGDTRSLNRRVRDERWHLRHADGEPLARPRAGKGGGTEYHVSLLPGPARLELSRRGLCATRPEPALAESPAAAAWRWFEVQTGKTRAEAERRLLIIAEVELLEESGMTRTAAVAAAARSHGAGPATVWKWLGMIDGVARPDRLPALAPRRKGGGIEADIDGELWRVFISDFLRPEEPTLALCYERTAEIAAARGLSLPSQKTLRRRLEKEVDPRIIRRLRGGKDAFARSLPAQRRTVAHLHAMECVNIDGHTFDVWVTSPEGKKIRPILLGIQDVRSSKLLAWLVCEVESAHYVRLVFGQLFAKFGIPLHAVLDNGRGFASKWITGHAAHRFRFKVKPEDPVGLIVKLGIKEHWTMPYHGQAKPIERAWKDLTDRISRNAFVSGAYTGPNPMRKPANYDTRVIPWDDFVAHVDRQVAKHNARLGRTGRDYRGRSFDDVFAESYAAAPISRATEQQLRLAMLAAERKMLSRQTGELNLFGNRYWSEECSRHHGKRVTVRFDPGDLTRDVHLYDENDDYLCSAQPWADVKFLDAESSRRTGKFVAEQKRKVREGIDAQDLLAAAQVAALEVGAPAFELPEAGAIRIVRSHGNAALKANAEPILPQQSSKILSLMGRLRLADD